MKPREYYGAPAHLQREAAAPKAPDAVPGSASAHRANVAQARCDAIQAEFRSDPPPRKSIRRDPPATPPALVPTENLLDLRLAEELEYARRMLNQMGDALAADPLVVGRHMVSLQAVDIIGQLLGHVANVVRSSDPDGAVDRIGMSDLKARLVRRGGV